MAAEIKSHCRKDVCTIKYEMPAIIIVKSDSKEVCLRVTAGKLNFYRRKSQMISDASLRNTYYRENKGLRILYPFYMVFGKSFSEVG